MLNFNVISIAKNVVDDDLDLVDNSYQNASLPPFQWSKSEEEMDIKGRTSQVVDRSQAWLEHSIRSHSGSSSQKGTPKETSTIAQASQRVVGKSTPRISMPQADSQSGGDSNPPEKSQKLKFVCEIGTVTPPKKKRTALQINSSEEDTQFLHQLGEQNPLVSLVDDVDPEAPPSDASLLTPATTINTLFVKSPTNPSSTPWLKKSNTDLRQDLKSSFDTTGINILSDDGKELLGGEVVRRAFRQKVEDSLSATNAGSKSLECLKDAMIVLNFVCEEVQDILGKITDASQKVAKWKIRVEATAEPTTESISLILSNFRAYRKKLNPQVAQQQ
ncbi:hypothetical protein SUGI_0899210 [Cryptomeria japonica]|nr:hypothetical protein SUGI_0899210 [Cryptomeria japonica]